MRLTLASTSPRRLDLLRSLGWDPIPLDPGLDDAAEAALAREAHARGLDPGEVALRLGLAKLLAGLRQAAPELPVLAADTVIAFGGALIGKPRDREHARDLLQGFAGQSHEVSTGVALVDASGALRCATSSTQVRMKDFDAATLEAFLDTDLWRGKAGGYGVQDPESAPLVAEVLGSESNVRGLPLEVVKELLG